MSTTNYEKYTTQNPIGKWFLNNFMNTLISTVRPLNVESILDVGTGEGFTLARLTQEKIGKKLEGIEYLKEAIKLGKTLHPHLAIKQGTIYQLPYKDNSFELVISTEVLEHLRDPKKGLQEVIRVSKKYVLLTVPNEPWFTIQRFLRLKNILQFGDHKEHVQHWTSQGFREFVKQNTDSKIRIIVKKYPFPWTMLLLDTFS
jgi:ubiquinone/menaquinone biosynthesis C-methylase UbiE